MTRILLISFLLLLPLESFSATKYTVKIAIYKNKNALTKQLRKLPPALRKTIKVTKRNGLNRASTLATENKKILNELLPSYRKVFPDAFVAPM